MVANCKKERDMPPSREEFWNFCLEIYAAKDVKDACLAAQDSHGADVNLMLLLLWHDREALMLADSQLDRLMAVSEHWQAQHLAPHRARRRAAKGTPTYDLLLREELDLERDAQAALLGALGRSAPGDTPDNLPRYMKRLSAPLSLTEPLLAAIRRA